jgi:hypothetical protein
MGQEKSGWTHAFSGWITPGGMSIRLVAKLNTKPSKLPMLALLSSLTFPFLFFRFSLLIKIVSSKLFLSALLFVNQLLPPFLKIVQ